VYEFSYVQGLWDNSQYACELEDASPVRSAQDIPAVTSVSPNTGLPAGGETVTIKGSDLAGATSVRFGELAAATFTVRSANEITAVTPSRLRGTVYVRVITPNGESPESSREQGNIEPGGYRILEGPEYGRCIATSGKNGRFASANCTKTGGASRYEWYPAFGGTEPLTKRHLTIASTTAATLADASGDRIACKGLAGNGEYTGNTNLGQINLTLFNCRGSGAFAGCQEDLTIESFGEGLGVAAVSAKSPADDKLAGVLGEGDSSLFGSCGNVVVTGSALASLSDGRMTTTASINLKEQKGRQIPETLAGGGERYWLNADVEESDVGQIGLALAATQTSEEPVELNPVF
jgi:hypothetical protein